MLSNLKAEFKLSLLALDHNQPELFIISKWQKSSPSVSSEYLVFRWFCALYHLCWCIACFLYEGGLQSPLQRKLYYFIYLTQWSYVVMTLMNLYWAVLVTNYRHTSKGQEKLVQKMGPQLKILWVLTNITFLCAILITAVYWLVIYDPDYPLSATNIETHVMNSLYVMVELFVSAIPVRFLHFYISMLYLILYLMFNLIYYSVGGLTPFGEHAIYPIMDWENLTLTLPFLGLTLLLTVLFQFTVWLVYIFSKWIVDKVTSTSSQVVDINMDSVDDKQGTAIQV